MKSRHFALSLLLCAAAFPVSAQTAVDQRNVTAEDVVTKPLDDLNITKEAVSPILEAALEQPYGLAGLRTCKALQAEVKRLDAALGDDIDVTVQKSRDEKRGNTVGNVARSVIGSFIPFGGVIREISGAAANERRMQVLLYAGASRRAFLKGYGQARGCRYPARAATAAQAASVQAQASTPPQAQPTAAEAAAPAKSRKRVTVRSRHR